MSDLDDLIRRVRRNCDVSDARHAGVFSICGLALRLRDLYKWENGLAPWQEGDPGAVLEWIGRKEQHWEALAGCDYSPLRLNGREFDPFDAEGINAVLAPRRLAYGAGLAKGLKATFFLAGIEAVEEVAGCTVHRLGRELARDLLAPPALTQGRAVWLRRESGLCALWDLVAYAAPSARTALAVALEACGISPREPAALGEHLYRLLPVQEAIHLRHELGEIHDAGFDRRLWREIVGNFAQTRVELLARRVKDLLADTHELGPLPDICRRRSAAGLALYRALTDGLSASLYPQLTLAIDGWLKDGGWPPVIRAVDEVRAAAGRHAAAISAVYRRTGRRGEPSRVAADIERHFGFPPSEGRRGPSGPPPE